MLIAKVVGSVVSTQKVPSLTGKKLMIIQMVNGDGSDLPTGTTQEQIAVDSVGAGVGEFVLVSRGASARLVFPEPNYAIDLAIVGIIDNIDK